MQKEYDEAEEGLQGYSEDFRLYPAGRGVVTKG